MNSLSHCSAYSRGVLFVCVRGSRFPAQADWNQPTRNHTNKERTRKQNRFKILPKLRPLCGPCIKTLTTEYTERTEKELTCSQPVTLKSNRARNQTEALRAISSASL